MISIDPVDDGLMIDCEDATNAAEVYAFQVKPYRLALDLIGVAEWLWVGRIDAAAGATLITLAAAHRAPVSSLVFCCLTVRTLAHAAAYNTTSI